MRQTKKRKRERRKRKKEGNLPFKNVKNPKQLNHTTKLISKFVVNKQKRKIHSLFEANGTEEDAKKKRKNKNRGK